MKKTLHISILIMLISFLFSSCKDEDNGNEHTYKITVASVKPILNLADILDSNSNKATTGYFLKNLEGGEWLENEDIIRGFNHEEGYEYILELKTIVILECISYEYELVKEISKIQKDSENIPLQKESITIASIETGDETNPYYILMDSKWIKFPTIEGFDLIYEEGYEYEVTIDCKYNGVNATPKYSFIYAETTKKEKKDSEGL